MNRFDIQLLQSVRGYPALTIMLPTHRTSPDNKQDPILLKNLLKEATDRLLAEFSKREVDLLLNRLNGLVPQIDFRNALDGLAVFVNRDFAAKFYLPIPVQQRVVIDETFYTRDLVRALNRSLRYWALVLSEQPTRLYDGLRDTLVEVTEHGFPMTHTGPGGETELPGGPGVQKSAYRDERHRQFFRQVDAAFGKVAAADPLPLALVGIDRYLSFFNEVSKNTASVVATITGSHDKTSPHELAKLVWPAVKESLAQQRHAVLDEVDKAVGARQYASGIVEAWRAAHEGRVATLVVEDDFHFPARLDAAGRTLLPANDPNAPDVMEDAVDDLIEMTLAKGGRVVFVDNGTLTTHQRIAAITRF